MTEVRSTESTNYVFVLTESADLFEIPNSSCITKESCFSEDGPCYPPPGLNAVNIQKSVNHFMSVNHAIWGKYSEDFL